MGHVGRRIAELREAAELTQADVAERCGMTVPNYQRLEYGLQNLTIETMCRIANTIGVQVSELFAPVQNPRTRKRGRPRRL